MFRPLSHRSFGYIEATISVTILSGAVLAALKMMGSYVGGVEIGAETQIARELAAELMSEIMTQPFEDAGVSGTIGRESGELVRADFDDVDDYNGWKETIMADINGNTHPVASQHQLGVRVIVEWVRPDTLTTTPTFTQKTAKKIRVMVLNRDKKIRFQLLGYRLLHDGSDGGS